MFLYESVPWYSILMWFIVVILLMGLNEVARRSLLASLLLFLVLPTVLTIVVWPQTVGNSHEIGSWFDWIKAYSALFGCLGFLALRFINRLHASKYALMFPAIALALNILMAVVREFEVYFLDESTVSGPWNIFNGVTGIINVITISGWMGIFISSDKTRDMVWPDQMWFWILAYNFWNFSFVYNCISNHSYYSGAALLASSIVPAFLIKKGAWLQHRAQTLAIWMLFVMSYPYFISSSMFAVQSSHNIRAFWMVSCLSLASNILVLIYHIYKISTHNRNPLKEEVYTDLASYKEVVDRNAGAAK